MHVQEDQADLAKVTQAILINSHCLDRNVEKMYELWQHVFSSVHWQDSNRLATLIKMSATGATNGLAQSGHRYAMASAASSLTPAGKLSEQFSGMSHLNLLKKLSQEDAEVIAKKLQRIAGIVLSKGGMRVALNTSAPEHFVKATESFLSNLGGGEGKAETEKDAADNFLATTLYQHYVTPFPINFTSLSIPTVSYSSPDSAPLKVLSGLLSAKYLHSEIREKGGAYGGGATAGSGAFTYYSYRDPNSLDTFSVFNQSADWVLGDNFGQAEVEEAVLRVFQGVDAPVAPGHKGMRFFLSGISDEDFALHRSRLRSVTLADLKGVAEKYLVEPAVCGKALIGGANKNLEEMGWKVHQQ